MGLPGLPGGAWARLRALIASASAPVVVISILLAFSAPLQAGDANENVFDSIIYDVSGKYSMDPLLIKAVIWNESHFRPRVTGAAGEIGLMQVKMSAVKDWADANKKPLPAKEQVYDPYLNIEIGTWFLARAMQRWDGKDQCYTLALCEYNAGRSRAVVWNSRTKKDAESILIGSQKTRSYVANVREKYFEYTTENAASVAVEDSPKQGSSLVHQ